MQIEFASKEMEGICNDGKTRLRKCGKVQAKLLQRRLDDLRAATTLETMVHLPGHCHEHRGKSPPVLTVDLDGAKRLYFEAAEAPAPVKADGGLDWAAVRTIRILRIDDPHGT